MGNKSTFSSIQIIMLLGIFRTGASNSTSFETVDEQLSECLAAQSSQVSNHEQEVLVLMDDYRKLQKDLEDLTAKSISDASYRHSSLQEKRNNNLVLRRTLAQSDITLNLKFDCFSNTNTLADCQQYCAFPYGYDSCTQTDEQKQFIRRVLNEAGWDKVVFRYYNRIQGPLEEVKLGPEFYQLTHNRNPHEHRRHRGHRRHGHNHESHHGPRRHGHGHGHRPRIGGGFHRRHAILPILNDTNICAQVHVATA